MKKTTKALCAVLMAVVLLCSCFALMSIGASASADEPSNLIPLYYFNDYYPTVPKSMMNEEYPEFAATYDHKRVNLESFYDLISNNYFDAVPYGSVVVIDIKTFKLDSGGLYDLFSFFKQRNCKTIFVSVYSIADYENDENENTDFLEYVDQYVHSDFERLKTFIHNFILWVEDNNEDYGASSLEKLQGTTILIDGHLLDFGEHYGDEIDEICEDSPFFRILLEKLAAACTISTANTTYAALLEALYNDFDISLVIHYDNDEYINLYNWSVYDCETFELLDEEDDMTSSYYAAIGFSHLDSDFFDFLVEGRGYVETILLSDMPVAILEVEPFEPGLSPLEFLTDRDLIELYEEPEQEWDQFFAALDAICRMLI